MIEEYDGMIEKVSELLKFELDRYASLSEFDTDTRNESINRIKDLREELNALVKARNEIEIDKKKQKTDILLKVSELVVMGIIPVIVKSAMFVIGLKFEEDNVLSSRFVSWFLSKVIQPK